MKINKLSEEYLEKTRKFMLDIIENEFGYKYNSDWHSDIANLAEVYLKNERAACYVCLDEKGSVVGTIAGKPYDRDFKEFQGKYTSDNTLGIWRHYVKADLRNNGIGTKLLKKLEDFAKQNNYSYLYLHTQKTIPGSLEYWLAKDYEVTHYAGDKLKTVHLEKLIRR